MIAEINDITLFSDNENIGIELIYATEPKGTITKIFLERYEVPKKAENVAGLRDVVDQQSVMQYLGTETAYMSTQLHMGGGDVFVEGKLIDITNAIDDQFPFIIDDAADRDKNYYIYRILSLGENEYEKSTRYVVGFDEYDALIDNEELPDYEYIRFLDKADVREMVPDNTDAVIEWGNGNSFFLETFRHRRRSEHEAFKHSSYETRAWIDFHFLSKILDREKGFIEDTTEGVQDETKFHTKYL